MASKPLSYESLKCVMEYMDVNKRFQISSRILSTRNIDTILPLKLKNLEISKSSITINTTKYSFGTILLKSDGEVPNCVQQISQSGGFPYDVDHFGNYNGQLALEEGDIYIDAPNRGIRIGNFAEMVGLVDNFRFPPELPPNFGLMEIHQLLEAMPYTHHVRLTVSNTKIEGIQYTRRLPDGLKIRAALRRLVSKILIGQNRKHDIVEVRRLKIGFEGGVIRLPLGIKLKIQELVTSTNGNMVVNSITPILDPSSFPLKSLTVEIEDPRDEVFQHEILTNAEFLDIRIIRRMDIDWKDTLISLPNSRIHFSAMDIPIMDIVGMAEYWIENRKEIGTKFSMQTTLVFDYLEGLNERMLTTFCLLPSRRCPQFMNSYTIQVSATSELNIYGYESPNHQEELDKPNGKPWMVVLEVMPFGSATYAV